MDLRAWAWSLIGWLSGAVPFAVLLARRPGGRDPREVGDRNPGAFNAWRAAGWRVGLLVLLLDFLKGAVPVGLARHWVGVSGATLPAVGLAPVVGHAFSPWLRFQGGKALAVTFGVWAGVGLGEHALVLGLFTVPFSLMLRPHAWAVGLGMLGLLSYLLTTGPSPSLVSLWIGNAAILGWKHWPELHGRPSLRRSGLAGLSGRLRR